MKTTSCPVQALFSVGCHETKREEIMANHQQPSTAQYICLYIHVMYVKNHYVFSNTPGSLACLHQKPALLGGVMEARIEANAGLCLGKHWALKLAF